MALTVDQFSLSSLATVLHNRILTQGPLSFAAFMESCLYHPQYGYYIGSGQRIGREGDFFTSSSVHAIFGQLIAKQLHQMWEILGCPADFIVAEQGAGTGHLALDILTAVQAGYPDFYSKLRYSIVELSEENRFRQGELLVSHQSRVRWCEQRELSGMVGCYLSNELVDAFPVHLVEKQEGKLLEVCVNVEHGAFHEILLEPTTEALSAYLKWVGVELAEGNRAEINLAAPLWLRNVAELLQRGFVLTIDYGYLACELFAPWRRSGTLMCYYQHTAGDNPYIRVGEQDLTTHVDFSALIKTGEESGLQKLFYGDQCKFLLGLGFVDALLQAQAREVDPHHAQALRLTLKNLILPEGGMGEVFKVLIQGKGVEAANLLCARSLRDLPLPVSGI